MSLRANLLALFCLFILTACGFQPLYGKYAVDRAELQNIRIENIPDKQGMVLRNALIDRFYPDSYPKNPRYSLRMQNIQSVRTLLGVQKSNIASRAQLRVQANLVLVDRQSNQTVLMRPLMSIVTYNILESQFATKIAEENALERGLNDIADETLRETSLYFERLRNGTINEAQPADIVTVPDETLDNDSFNRRFRTDLEKGEGL